MTDKTERLNIHAGDRDITESYIVVILSKEELLDASERVYATRAAPNTEEEWKQTAQDVGIAIWQTWTGV